MVFLSLLVLIVFSPNVYAQWSTSGSNVYYDAGNVGIGTSLPFRSFDVAGSCSGTGFDAQCAAGLMNKNTTANNASYLTFDTQDGNGSFLTSSYIKGIHGTRSGANTSGAALTFFVNSGSGSTNLEAMRIFQGGNVSIGTNTSLNRLDVFGSGSLGSAYAGARSAPTNGLIVQGNVSIGTSLNNNVLDVAGAATIGYTGNKIAPANGLLVLGNVGIGTTLPFRVFDVAGSCAGTGFDAECAVGLMNKNTTANNASYLTFDTQDGNGSFLTSSYIKGIHGTRSGANTSGAALTFFVNSGSGSNNAEAVRIVQGGNVGIGTIAPIQALDVAGSIRSTGIGATGKALCAKADKTIGYCSTQPDASGSCTCN